MAALDSIYENLLKEAWSKTIAGNGKNTLLVHTEADFKPEDIYYVFVCKPVAAVRPGEKYTWQTSPSIIKFSTGDNEDNWKNLRIIEDKLIKGSDVISYIKNKETKLLSGLTQYILDIRYINTTVKDAIYASLHTNTKTGPGRFAAGYYFVSVNALGGGVPDLKTYFNIVKSLWDKGNRSDLDPMYVAAETLPYIEDLINVRNIHHKNAEITGIDTSGLLEGINWDDPFPYGKVDRIVISTIKSYNPEFSDVDINDAYSAFYGWLQKQEDLPDDMGVQEWYDNAVENFRDADQYERRGMDEDEEAAAEEGYIDAAENLLIQQLNAFFNGDSEEYKDFLKSRDIHKKGSEISGIDTSGLLEGGLSFDAGTDKFNFVEYCKSLSLNDTDIRNFADWIVNYSEIAEEVRDYGGEPEDESWVRVSIYYDANIENTAYLAAEKDDLSILLDRIKEIKIEVVKLYNQYRDFTDFHKGASEIAGIDTTGLIETTTEICEQATLNPNGELIFGKYRIFQAGSGTQTAPYAQAINDTNLFSNRLANDVKVLETLGFKFDTVYYYQPPPRAGKYIARAIAISGTDNNGEDIMWVRKGGFMAPAPAIYYKDRRGGDVKSMARSLALQLKPANVVTAEDFLKAAVSPYAKIEKGGGWGYKRKKIKLRPDGKYDILGEVYLTDDYTKHLVGKPFVINSLDDLPVKFGVVVGQLTVKLPVLNIDWFPEKFDGLLYFQVEAGMTPERFLEAGLLDRVTDDTEISFTTGEVDKFGFNKKIKFKSKADWIDTMKAQDIHQKASDITGIDTSGLLESKGNSNIGKWVSIMLKAAEELAQDPKALVMAPNKARLVSADFWTSIPPSDGSVEGIRENFLNAIKQAQNFDIQNGNFSPAKNKFKKMKYDPKRLGSLSSGYQVYAGDLSSPEAQEEIKKDFIYKANRALFYRMESVAEKEYPGNRWYTIIGPLTETGNIIKDFVKGDLKEIKDFLKDYLDSQNISQKSTDITGIDTSGLLEESTTDGRVTEFVKALIEVDNFKDFKRIAKQLPDISNTINGTPVGLLIKDAISGNIGPLQDDGTPSLWFPATPQDFFYKALYYYIRYHSSDSKSSRAFNKSLSYRQGPSLEELEKAFNKWRDFKTSQDIHQKSTDITGIDTSGLLEGTYPEEDKIEAIIKALTEVNNFEDFKRLAEQLPNLTKSLIYGIRVDLLVQQFIYTHIGPLKGNASPSVSVQHPTTPQDFFYRALFYYVWYNTAEDKYFDYFLRGISLQEIEEAFNKWRDLKASQEIHQKSTNITGIDTSGLLESWADDIEDYWKHYYNVGDPGPIGAIKDWPGLLFFNKWFVDMIDRENWNVDSIEDYFIEYSDRVADNLEQKDNEDRGYGELQKIACYRGYKKLYSYYRQFLSDTDSQIYKDWKSSEAIHQKTTDVTGIDTSGLLEQGKPASKKPYITEFNSIITKAKDARTFNDFEAAFEGTDPNIWNTDTIGKFFHKVFVAYFNTELLIEPLVTINSKNDYERTKFGHLYEAINHYGEYLLLSRTDAEADRFSRRIQDARLEAALVYKKQAEHYFNNYIDIINAEEIHKKATDITGIDTSGLLESGKVFNPEIYDIHKKALEADSFEEFKELIKQLPDPWKYDVMVGGGANARAIIKDILGLKDIPSSYNPKTPADHFLTAVDHIQDVEHSTSVTLDDIRAGYAYAQEHFAKWLEYKKSQEIHQKTTDITGIDTSGLMEEANRVLFDKRFALMKWGRAIPGSNQFARHWALTSGFSEEDIENFGGQQWLIDGLIDWFVDMEGDKIKYQGGQVYKTGNLSQEEQIALYQKIENDAVEAVKNDLEELYKDWMKSQEIYSKVTDITGIDTSGLLENATDLANSLMQGWKYSFIDRFNKTFKPSAKEAEKVYRWFVIKATHMKPGNIKNKERAYDKVTELFADFLDTANSDPEVKYGDLHKVAMKLVYDAYKDDIQSQQIHQTTTDITGIDTSGLLESNDNVISDQDKTLFFRTVEDYKKYLPEIPDTELINFYNWFNNVKRVELGFGPYASDNESSWEVFQQIAWVAAEDVFGIPEHEIPDEFRSVAEMMMEKLYDEYKAHYIYKKSSEITGIDTSGLLESEDDDSSRERYWDHALEATATDWINSFKSYVGLERANKIYTWLLNKARVEHDPQATYNNLIDMYGQFARERKKKDGLSEWSPPNSAKVLADIADAYDAEIIAQKTTDITGIDTSGLLEAARYTGPGGPVKDKQGKEHDSQGWYNIIKPFIIDLLKAVENNDFSTFVKLVDSRQKNMGGPGFNPYFNLVDKVYAKVLQELLDNEQAENAFDEAYSTVQSMIVYIDVHLKDQWDRDPNTLQRIPNAQIKQEYPRAVAAFNKFKDFLDAKNIHQKSTDITGIDTSGLLEAKSKSTPEEDKHWGNVIYDYIDKLVNANTFEEFVGLVEKKPATFQFNPGMYYHDKIFVNAIDSILGGHDKETGNPVRSSFVAAFSAIQSFLSFKDLFFRKVETTPYLENEKADAIKKFNEWIETRQDWKRSQEIHQKAAEITGIDTSGLLE